MASGRLVACGSPRNNEVSREAWSLGDRTRPISWMLSVMMCEEVARSDTLGSLEIEAVAAVVSVLHAHYRETCSSVTLA